MPPPLIDVQLIAWHHMINDPFLSTYTFENGIEQRKRVNPKLAWKRSLIELGDSIRAVSESIQNTLFGSLTNLAESFKPLVDAFNQSGLEASFTDAEVVE